MITRITLSHDWALKTMDHGDITDDILLSDESVAMILTQSWCPQWTFMNRSIDGLGGGPEDLDISVYVYEYDKSPHFARFMAFKESTYQNWEVPYVRLYRKGRFIGEGNAMPGGRMIEAIRNAG